MSTVAINTSFAPRVGGPSVVAQRPSATKLRITKRGRRVLLALVTIPLAIAAMVLAVNGGMATATDHGSSTSLQYVTVQPGESLWQLAESLAPSSDPRDVIADVVQLNQLSGTDVQAGERLAIPAQYSH